MRRTRVALVADGDGRPRLELATGLLAPRVVRLGPAHAEVALVATTATLLGGDVVRLEVEVGAGTWLDLRDVAGTVAYHGRGRPCRVDVRLRVAEGATLAWAGEPLVVSGGADVTRTLDVEVAAGGRLLLRDTVALGRTGEAGGELTCSTTMAVAGRPALVEHLRLGAAARGRPGVLGDARVVDTLTALGWQPTVVPSSAVVPPPAVVPSPTVAPTPFAGTPRGGDPDVFRLEQPGAVARALTGQAHESGLGPVWHRWRAELGTPGRAPAQHEPPL